MINYTGKKFGYWVVINGINDPLICKCCCGKVDTRYRNNIVYGKSKSCGCKKSELISKKIKAHGFTGTRIYRAWCAMYTRCTNPKFKDAHIYSKKGIKICKRWGKFENFLADMGEPKPGMSLDRINPNKGYSPKNCRWATAKQQARNTSRNKRVTHKGKTLTLVEWGEITGISKHLISARLRLGWSVKDTLEIRPVLGRNKH